jgi:hypothetical protein
LMRPTPPSFEETPLEAALGRRELHVGEVRDIIFRQLTLKTPNLWPPAMNALPGHHGAQGEIDPRESGSRNPARGPDEKDTHIPSEIPGGSVVRIEMTGLPRSQLVARVRALCQHS